MLVDYTEVKILQLSEEEIFYVENIINEAHTKLLNRAKDLFQKNFEETKAKPNDIIEHFTTHLNVKCTIVREQQSLIALKYALKNSNKINNYEDIKLNSMLLFQLNKIISAAILKKSQEIVDIQKELDSDEDLASNYVEESNQNKKILESTINSYNRILDKINKILDRCTLYLVQTDTDSIQKEEFSGLKQNLILCTKEVTT